MFQYHGKIVDKTLILQNYSLFKGKNSLVIAHIKLSYVSITFSQINAQFGSGILICNQTCHTFTVFTVLQYLLSMHKCDNWKSYLQIQFAYDTYLTLWWPRRHSFSLFHILGCPSLGSNSGLPYSSTTRYPWATSPP